MKLIDILLMPEVLGLLVTLAALFLAKSKIFTERDYKQARDMLDMGCTASQIAGRTRLRSDEIKQDVQGTQGADTVRNRILAAAKALLRGWLR